MLSIEGEEVCKDQDWKWDGTPLVSSKPYGYFFRETPCRYVTGPIRMTLRANVLSLAA